MKLPIINVNILSLWKVYRFFKKHVLRKPVRRYRLNRDKWDDRDRYYKTSREPALPVTTDRKNISEFYWRYDQGELGSCCAFGMIEAFRRTLQVNKMPDFAPSALFSYWTLRTDKNRDCGGEIRNGFKALNLYGLCSENKWPYNTFRFKELPPADAFVEGLDHQSIIYERIYPVTKTAIMDAVSKGYPVVYGKELFSSFESDWVTTTGIVEMPKKCESMIGAHAMVIFDYDELGTVELNSWGKSWGIDGTCHVPWEYVLNGKWCFDFWVLYKSE